MTNNNDSSIKTSYDQTTVILHWAIAVLVISLLVLGLLMQYASPDRETKLFYQGIHISIAILAYVFLAWRIIYFIRREKVSEPKQSKIFQGLARWIPRLLLIAIAIQMLTGPFIVWTGGRDIQVFNWFSIPTPFERMADLHHLLEDIHGYSAKSMLALLILHIGGVIKHVFIDKDNVLKRMLNAGNTLDD